MALNVLGLKRRDVQRTTDFEICANVASFQGPTINSAVATLDLVTDELLVDPVGQNLTSPLKIIKTSPFALEMDHFAVSDIAQLVEDDDVAAFARGLGDRLRRHVLEQQPVE